MQNNEGRKVPVFWLTRNSTLPQANAEPHVLVFRGCVCIYIYMYVCVCMCVHIYSVHLYKGSRLCRALLGLSASLAAGRVLDGIPVRIHKDI